MPNLLKNLEVTEVSHVDRGANSGAKTVFMKMKDVGTEMSQELIELAKKLGWNGDVTDKIKKESEMTVEEMIAKMAKDFEVLKKDSEINKSITGISIAISKAKDETELKAQETELAKLDQSDARVAVLKEQIGNMRKAKGDAAALEAHKAKAETFKSTLPDTLKQHFDNMDQPTQADYMDNFGKTAANEEVTKALIELTKSNKEQAIELAKMRDDREVELLLKSEFKGFEVVGNAEEIVKSIVKLRKSAPAQAEVVLTAFKGLVEKARVGKLFSVAGVNGGDVSGSAEQQIEKMAKDVEKSRNISFAKAYEAVLAENPKLYEQFNIEKRAAVKAQ